MRVFVRSAVGIIADVARALWQCARDPRLLWAGEIRTCCASFEGYAHDRRCTDPK